MSTNVGKVPLWLLIIVGMVLGAVVGLVAGRDAVPLENLGKVVIDLIKAAAAPLLFLSIINALVHSEVTAKSGGKMIVIALVNATIALGIGLLASNLFQPGSHLELDPTIVTHKLELGKPLDLAATLQSYIPKSFVAPFVDNAILSLVIIALLFGLGLRRVKKELPERFRSVDDLLVVALRTTEVVLGWIIRLVPLAVFGVVAKAVGEQGFRPVAGLAAYVAVGIGGLTVHALVTYHVWLVAYVRMPIGRFWRAAKDPVVYAIGANSSLATLPVTLRALDRLGVRKESSALGACVGTNLNNDGIILYEAMAVLFIAQANGVHLDAGQQLLAVATCMIAAMGIAGIPEAGFISLTVVVATVGLSPQYLPLLLTVDWIIARGRSAVNVLSDMLVSIILDRWSGHRFDQPEPVEVEQP